jgi:hypothetical protein
VIARTAVIAFGIVVVLASTSRAQLPPSSQSAPPIQRLGPDLLRIGNVDVDTAKKQVSVRGTVNEVLQLEFLAHTKGGMKAYESALELDTNAVNFNTALILVGLDPSRAVVPRFQFDPTTPKGDPVAISVEWTDAGVRRRVPAERVLYNKETGQTLQEGPWVYTGSVFYGENGSSFLAEMYGTIIGFMHTPSSLIETPHPILGTWGSTIVNPSLNLKPGTEILLTVQVLPRGRL